jgi:hypothetical protein
VDTRDRSLRIAQVMLGLLASGMCAAALAQSSSVLIYTCTTADGKRLSADRPIPECVAREQRLLNRDGSLRAVVSPPLTASERADREAVERQAALEKRAKAEAARRDRNLLARYADEAAHRKARQAALATVNDGLKASDLRLSELAEDRKKLLGEAEFYKGKALPAKLQQQLDSNEAASVAQRQLVETQQAEVSRINRLYDTELDRLRKLRAGAAPGSLGPIATSVAEAAITPTTSSSTTR